MRYVIYHIAGTFQKILFTRAWSGKPSVVISKFNDRYCGMCGRYYDSEKGHVCLSLSDATQQTGAGESIVSLR